MKPHTAEVERPGDALATQPRTSTKALSARESSNMVVLDSIGVSLLGVTQTRQTDV